MPAYNRYIKYKEKLSCNELEMVEKLALATKELLQTIYRDGIDIKTLHKLASSCFMQTDRRSSKIGRRAKSALAIRY